MIGRQPRSTLFPYTTLFQSDVEIRALPPGDVRGLGLLPVALSFTPPTGYWFRIAAPAECVELLAGPFLAATLSGLDRKSTRLNSSHANISYAVFCLKKKNPQ